MIAAAPFPRDHRDGNAGGNAAPKEGKNPKKNKGAAGGRHGQTFSGATLAWRGGAISRVVMFSW